ncbi:hypothetical protein [Cohnella yongneupensis]|uniref:RNA polymerase sigma factor 70 region 4 type 2 domain-containing protein n=1 Tax=Cohnella yongneupensis TaxID=425006 RepID=A0ABW0R3T9_9BACL
MNMFRKLDQEFQMTKEKLETLTQPEELRFEAKKLQLLTTLIAYVNSFEWITHRQTKEKIRVFLRSNFQYKAVAQKLGISLNSLQVSVSYASKKLQEKMGTSLLLLQRGDLEAAEREFLIAIGRSEPFDLCLEGFSETMPDAEEIPDVDLTTCLGELKLLVFFTRWHVQKLVGSYDVKKLKMLLHIITSLDPMYVQERDTLIRCLDGNISVAEAIGRLKQARG